MILQTDEEIKNLLYYSWLTRDVPGDVVEVGVYRGGSAQVLDWGRANEKTLYLIESFGGNNDGYDDMFDWKGAEEEVRKLLPSAVLCKGMYQDKFISLAHLDVDSFEATKKYLERIYPLISKGGVIILHDYNNPHLRVKDACAGYKVIPLSTSQGVIIKQ